MERKRSQGVADHREPELGVTEVTRTGSSPATATPRHLRSQCLDRRRSSGNLSRTSAHKALYARVDSLMPLLLGWALCHKTDHLSIGKRMSVLCSSESDCHTADGIVATSRLSSAYQHRT